MKRNRKNKWKGLHNRILNCKNYHMNLTKLKTTLKVLLVVAVMTITSVYGQTPNNVDTRIGALAFDKGFPTAETTKKLFDEIDFQRAVQAYLWSYPLVSFESMRLAAGKEYGLADFD